MSFPFDVSDFGLVSSDVSYEKGFWVVTKESWEYAKALSFQRQAKSFVQDHPEEKFLVCCSHPPVLTHGRGLQKPKKGQSFALTDFDFNLALPFDLFKIERGGGLTFHHPGQFIFYPILKLHPQRLGLSRMVDDMLDVAQKILRDQGLSEANHESELLGLWSQGKKLASVGIAVDKLVTFHGMALNLSFAPELKDKLSLLAPCGLKSTAYSSVQDELGEGLSFKQFQKRFLEEILHAW